jgi:hypothetical protein
MEFAPENALSGVDAIVYGRRGREKRLSFSSAVVNRRVMEAL